MRSTVAGFLASVLMVAVPALSAAAAEPTAQDYVKEIQSSTTGKDASPAPGAACENGEARDEAGACPDVDDSSATRGFTLFSGSMNKPQGQTAAPTAAPTPTTQAARAVRPAQAPATIPRSVRRSLALPGSGLSPVGVSASGRPVIVCCASR